MTPETEADREPSRAWLESLRARFLAVASRRVPRDAVEDVVQDALRVVAERGLADTSGDVDGLPRLAWCFQVLRNVIGNHYQKSRTREAWSRRIGDAADPGPAAPTPLDALASDEAAQAILAAIEEMRARRDACARYLGKLAGGSSPAELALEERLEAAVLYRRIYRCRHKLREVLLARGVLP